jgi:5'-nucleotidase
MLAPDAIQGLRFTRQSTGTIVAPRLIAGTDGRGLVYHWLSFDRDTTTIDDPLSDVVALRDGYVSATPLHGSRCDEALLERSADRGAWRLDISERAE